MLKNVRGLTSKKAQPVHMPVAKATPAATTTSTVVMMMLAMKRGTIR